MTWATFKSLWTYQSRAEKQPSVHIGTAERGRRSLMYAWQQLYVHSLLLSLLSAKKLVSITPSARNYPFPAKPKACWELAGSWRRWHQGSPAENILTQQGPPVPSHSLSTADLWGMLSAEHRMLAEKQRNEFKLQQAEKYPKPTY